MAPGRPAKSRKAKNVGITPDPELLDWLHQHMGPGLRWNGPTHFFNWSIRRVMDEEANLDDALDREKVARILELVNVREKGTDGSKKPKK